ncbi:MAG: DJ-1/PfpI family protein [Bacteroidota bacterium]
MRLAYVLYDELTLLDFIGFYDPVSRLQSQGHLPDFDWDLCAMTPTIKDSFGLEITADLVKPDLGTYDILYVPGGFGTRSLQHDKAFLAWLKTAGPVPLKTSVCTGSLLLGAAGFLEGVRATTHFNEYASLAPYCKEVIHERIVDAGSVITAGAVATSLDLGLYLCEKLVGSEKTVVIRKSMDYWG